MSETKRGEGWRMADALWQQMEPLLPLPKQHPLGCHRPRVSNRAAIDVILLVRRTGMQWNALDRTGICSCPAAYRRFRDWVDAGVFEAFWRCGLLECEKLQCIDWKWLALDDSMAKAPLGGGNNRTQPHRPRQRWRKAQCAHRWAGSAVVHRGGTSEPTRYEARC